MATERPIRPRGGSSAGRRLFAPATSLGLVLAFLGVPLGIFFHGRPAPRNEQVGAAVVVVDSVFPVEEEIRRFRAGLTEATALSGGAGSRDELVERFLRAVERRDRAALARLMLSREEFAWLYYPHSMYTAPPYRLSPALLWFQIENLSSSGLARLLERAEQSPLRVRGYRCEDSPRTEGPNRVWDGCLVTLDLGGAEPADVQVFGSVVERGGVHKFVSYASGL